MASLDVDSLFTNIPLDENIDICGDNFYIDNKNPPNFLKHDFCNLFNISTKETFFYVWQEILKTSRWYSYRISIGTSLS